MSPVRGPRPAAVVLGWEGRAGSAGSRTIYGRTAATWRWIGQGEVTLEPRSRGIGFPGDPEPKCRSRLRKQCLHRKAGVACRLPASVGADGGRLWARPRVAEARGWTGSVCDAARENADVFPTRGFQRLRSWARGSAWGHIVVPSRGVPHGPRGSLELGFARTPGPRAPRVLCKRWRMPASHLCREPFLVKENLLRAIVWLPLKHVYDGELSPSSAQPAPFLDSCGG